MSTNDEYIGIDIAISFESHEAMAKFIARLTGNDDDIFLAAETAMNQILGVDDYTEGVQVHPPSKEDLAAILGHAMERKERDQRAALIRLGYDAKISELVRERDAALAEYQ